MPDAITPLSDFDRWARNSALEIVLFVTGAILVTRLARWTSQKVTERIDRRSGGQHADDLLTRGGSAFEDRVVAAGGTYAERVPGLDRAHAENLVSPPPLHGTLFGQRSDAPLRKFDALLMPSRTLTVFAFNTNSVYLQVIC